MRREQGLDSDDSEEDYDSETDSETCEHDRMGAELSGIFSRVAGVGLDVLSAFIWNLMLAHCMQHAMF